MIVVKSPLAACRAEPEGNVFRVGDHDQAGHFLHGYRSAWLPASLLTQERQSELAEALFAGSRHWGISLHFNKGLAGAPEEERTAAKDTAINPAVIDAFALAIIAGNSPPAFPHLQGHEPDLAAARRDAAAINRAMEALLKVAGRSGSYVSESDFFERGRGARRAADDRSDLCDAAGIYRLLFRAGHSVAANATRSACGRFRQRRHACLYRGQPRRQISRVCGGQDRLALSRKWEEATASQYCSSRSSTCARR